MNIKHYQKIISRVALLACMHLAMPVTLMANPSSADPADSAEKEISKDSSTEINVKNADIAAIVRIFSRKTKRNYILDEKVKGKVSIYLPGKVSAEESLRILDSVLSLKGFSTVPIGDNLWKIVPAKEARQSTIPTRTEGRILQPTSSVVTRLVALKYVSAQDVQQIVSQLVSSDGLVNAYTGTNSLILIDAEDNIERLLKIIDQLDVPFSNREMTILPIKHAEVEDISQKLNDILGESNSKEKSSVDPVRASIADPNLAAQGQRASIPGASSTGKTIAARGLVPKIIPDQRTNSLIIVADDETTARIRALVAQLDSKVDLSGNKFYVYRCQHANAEELSQVLAGLVGGGSGGAGGIGAGGLGGGAAGVFDQSGGFGQNRNSSQRSGSAFGRSSPGLTGGFGGAGGANAQGRGGARTGQRSGPTSTQLGENISITADPATNSLIIAASKPDYEKIRTLLAQIDVKRRQALVEATLLEVSIDNSVRTSTSFLTSTGGADGGAIARSDFSRDNGLTRLFSEPAKLQGLTLAAASAGSLKLPGGLTVPTQSILVSAAQQNNNVNVLSAPTILATDNEEAQIVVGQNVPFLASTGTNAVNLNNTFNQVDRQDVGITLRITPQISSRDYVTLRVYTEVSALVLSTVDSALGPTTTKRQSETTIIAKDGQMIVTGGLISDDVSETDEGIPYLKDIPVLGHAFKSNSQARAQKNLLIFLTPRIIKDQFDARDSTIESRDKMEDVIADYNVQPKRRGTLRNEKIDQVAESNAYEGPKPGTILPPSRTTKEEAEAARIPTQGDDGAVVLDGSDDGMLDLDLAAPAPAKSSQRAPSPASKSAIERSQLEKAQAAPQVLDLNGKGKVPEARASLRAPMTSSQVGAATSRASFVVMEYTGSMTEPSSIPLPRKATGQRFGAIIPSDSSDFAKSFFRPGGTYTFASDKSRVELRIRGTFASPVDAEARYPEVSGSWYTLPAREVKNLGRGPWLLKGGR
jgi:general secretion pathway protein D